MNMTDNEGKQVNIDWLRADVNEIKSGLKNLNDKWDSFVIKDCPARHKAVDESMDALRNRLTALEVRVYIVVVVFMVIAETIVRRVLG